MIQRNDYYNISYANIDLYVGLHFFMCADARGCVWMRVGKEGGRGRAHAKAIVARTMPRPHDVGWCAWVCVGAGGLP